jgi:hypothetical protein
LFYRSNFGANLNPFEIKLILFENRIRRTVLPAPPISTAPTASPRCLTSRPGPPVSYVVPCRADPAALHCRAATRQTCAPRPGRCRTDATPPCCSTSCPGPPSLSRSASTRRPPLRAPSPPLPFKTEPPSVHARALLTHPPLPRRQPHWLPATGAPPPCRTPPEHRRRRPPSGERPPSCSIPQSTATSSPRWSPSSCRTPPRALMTTGALPSPTPATASAPTLPLHPLTSSCH